MNDYNAGQITRLCAGGQFIAATGITGAVNAHAQSGHAVEGLNQNGATHKTKATPKDRQCGNTKPIQDNHMSAISAMNADKEKALHLTICNQYAGGKVWCSLVAVYDHFSAVSMMRHAACNGAVFFDGVGLAPTHTNTDETPRRPRMVTLAGQPQGWPVSLKAGILTPVNVTAPIERENSSGDSLNYFKEAA